MENPIEKAEKKIGFYVLGAIIILIIVFFAGTKFAVKTAQNQSEVLQNTMGARGFVRGASGTILGTVIKKDDQSITLQSQDGSTKIIFLSGSTQITKTVNGTISDVAIGGTVSVSGTSNTDGSINGQTVQLRSSRDLMMR
ncbi:MAG: hypothetical protein WA051_00225 [Minisyncoccia bacterium]